MKGPNGMGVQGGQSAPVILTPLVGQFAPVGVAMQVTVRVPAGTPALAVKLGAQAPVAAIIVGTTATATVTPTGAEVGVATALTATSGAGVASTTVDVEANLAGWYDAANPASYTASGSNLTAVKSLLTATPLATVVGTPQVIADPRTGQEAFYLANPSYLTGADATVLAAAAGTDRPFCMILVVNNTDPAASGVAFSAASSGSTGNGIEWGSIATGWFTEVDGAPSGPAHLVNSEPITAGQSVVVVHSADGLTIKTSVNGGAESSGTITSVGAITPNRVGFGVQPSLVATLPWNGVIYEAIYFGVDKTAPQIAAMVNWLLSKRKTPPVVYFIGDSITTSQNATPPPSNGGMVALLASAVRTAGGILDPEGPYVVGQPVPFKHSAVAGDTCVQMTARVTSNTLGLGVGGSSKGYYRRARLALIFAGTNGPGTAAQTATDYQALLTATQTQLAQVGVNWRIAVTTITNINTGPGTAFVAAYNALLPAIWDAFDAAHPANPLIRWDAFTALPNPGPGTYYVDSTHPTNLGYVQLVSDPVNGLAQAVMPYLLSIQP